MKRAFVVVLAVAVVIVSIVALSRVAPAKARGFGPFRLTRD